MCRTPQWVVLNGFESTTYPLKIGKLLFLLRNDAVLHFATAHADAFG